MSTSRKLLRIIISVLLASVLTVVLAGAGLYAWLNPSLPSVESLKGARFQVPLRVYTEDGLLIAEFGDKKRTPIRYQNLPPLLVKALLAAEDDRFFEHPGVDYQGLLRAAANLITTGEKSQGGSTITMQVARNFFLTREKTYLRKLNEILLALKIDRELTKEEILELYLNEIYFGNRAYGVAAAAQVYYGKHLAELTLPEIATIVGLPKAPSRYNPIADEHRSTLRRNYVLGRMHALGHISDQQLEEARSSRETAAVHNLAIEVEAPYVAEMVRQEMVARFGEEDAYNAGYVVYTTLSTPHQGAATRALRSALLDYDQRHGYRGPIQTLTDFATLGPEQRLERLRNIPVSGGLQPALVIEAPEAALSVLLQNGEMVQIALEHLMWARPYIDEGTTGPKPKAAHDVAKPGDVVVVNQSDVDGRWSLVQVPLVSGALVALDANSGAVRALVGGWDFYQSTYNRVIQAQRQPGSSFKPFIYAAALDKGYTPANIINDAPVVFEDPALESEWRPENFSGEFFGPTRLREALVHSRNLASIRLLQAIGLNYAARYATRFGFDAKRIPRNLSLALGSGSVTPLELARASSAFANGGFLTRPFHILRVLDARGNTVFEANPEVVCRNCEEQPSSPSTPEAPEADTVTEPTPLPQTTLGNSVTGVPPATPTSIAAPVPRHAPRVIPPQTAYLVNSMMTDVIRRGTGRKALSLGRNDLAGKTGTTNDQRDAWFVGFNADLVAVTWVGFDEPKPLGPRETGGSAALPMWINFMAAALDGVPEHALERPPGLVTVRIDPDTGLLATADSANAIFETFPADRVPIRRASTATQAPTMTNPTGASQDIPQELF